MRSPLRLHLGCGANIIPGYVNIDDDPRRTGVDLVVSLLDLGFAPNTVGEIRSHHVFEHFHRYEAVAIVATWNRWLRGGGQVIVETPNFEACARAYLGYFGRNSLRECAGWIVERLTGRRRAFAVVNERERWLVLRHLYGSKEADWANHLEGWDRFTLSTLFTDFGFNITSVEEHEGATASIIVRTTKSVQLGQAEFDRKAQRFLKRMAINKQELPIWVKKAKLVYERLLTNPVTQLSN